MKHDAFISAAKMQSHQVNGSNGDYAAFIEAKSQIGMNHGFEPLWMPDFLFDFQRALVEWAIKKGRAAIFADCGLGKTPMQLVCAENIARKTNRPVLILAPLAVSNQFEREAALLGMSVTICASGDDLRPGVNVTNYQKLHKFDTADLGGVALDESSILKSQIGRAHV